MSTNYPLPGAFAGRMREQLGPSAGAYFAALERPYLRGLRLNPRKPVPNLRGLVEGIGEPVPWYPAHGRYLSLESGAGADPLHEAGAYYLQEPSAMAPVSVLAPVPGERVLDLCAAPGGKSTQIADALDGKGLLVCNEPVPGRARILSRNLERMGVINALAVSAEPEQLCGLWPDAFDAVLVDAPCSGEGMFRRHPEARAEWSAQSPAGCAARQRRILVCACRMLKPGGRLVYSTCTLNLEENEQTVAWLLENEPGMEAVSFSLTVGDGSLTAPDGTLHLYPHEIRGEGHFVALLRKGMHSGKASTDFLPAASRLQTPPKTLLDAYGGFAASLVSGGEALPPANACLGNALIFAPDLPPLDGIRVLRAGLQLGALKGKVFAPDHALAMGLPQSCPFPRLPLSREAALTYQRGETPAAPEALRGYALATWQGLALGFGKASGGQFKNHYPKGLRRP